MHWAGAIKTERKDAQRVPAKTFICSLSRNAGFFSLFCSKITIHNSELKKQVSGFIHGSAYFIGFSLKICRSSAATARRWCFRPRFGAKQRSFTASVTDIRVMIFTQSLKRCEDLGTVAKTAATQLFWTGVATDISAVRNRSATEDYYWDLLNENRCIRCVLFPVTCRKRGKMAALKKISGWSFPLTQWFPNFWSHTICGSRTVTTYHLVPGKFNVRKIILSKVWKTRSWHKCEMNKMAVRLYWQF